MEMAMATKLMTSLNFSYSSLYRYLRERINMLVQREGEEKNGLVLRERIGSKRGRERKNVLVP